MCLPTAFETNVVFIYMFLDFYQDKANKYLVLVSVVTEAYNLIFNTVQRMLLCYIITERYLSVIGNS